MNQRCSRISDNGGVYLPWDETETRLRHRILNAVLWTLVAVGGMAVVLAVPREWRFGSHGRAVAVALLGMVILGLHHALGGYPAGSPPVPLSQDVWTWVVVLLWFSFLAVISLSSQTSLFQGLAGTTE